MKRKIFHLQPWFLAFAIAAVLYARQTATAQDVHKISVASSKISNNNAEEISKEMNISSAEHKAHGNIISEDQKNFRNFWGARDLASDYNPPTVEKPAALIPDSLLNERKLRATSFIISGTPSKPGEFPYFVQVNGACGGTLIAPTIVLTAAHCKPMNLVGKVVTVGASLRDIVDNRAERIVVLEGASHPMHGENAYLNNDFGLLLLERPYDMMSTSIKLVLNEDPGFPPSGEMLDVIGMGATVYEGDRADELRNAPIPATSDVDCQATYKELTNKMMCAGEIGGGVDACQGDSGAPLLKRNGNVHVQVGIVSWGKNCGKYPGVYARISSGYSWIQKQVCEEWQVASPDLCGMDLNIRSPEPVPTPELENEPETMCQDDPNFSYKGDSSKNCKWASRRRRPRCKKKGSGGRAVRQFCKKSCRKCK